MKRFELVPSVILGLRGFGCALATVFFFYDWRFAAFTVVVLSTGLGGLRLTPRSALPKSSALADPLTPLETIGDKTFTLTSYFLLMLTNACPPWFVALLISVSLLQMSALVYLRWPEGRALPVAPSEWGRLNGLAQAVWIFCVLAIMAFDTRHPESLYLTSAVATAGYVALASAQFYVFYSYCLRFQRYFLPGFRTAMTGRG